MSIWVLCNSNVHHSSILRMYPMSRGLSKHLYLCAERCPALWYKGLVTALYLPINQAPGIRCMKIQSCIVMKPLRRSCRVLGNKAGYSSQCILPIHPPPLVWWRRLAPVGFKASSRSQTPCWTVSLEMAPNVGGGAQQKRRNINTVTGDSWMLWGAELGFYCGGRRPICANTASHLWTFYSFQCSRHILPFSFIPSPPQFSTSSLANHFFLSPPRAYSLCVFTQGGINPFVHFSPSQGPLNI